MKVRTITAKKVSAMLHDHKNVRKVLHELLLKLQKKHEQKRLHHGICLGVENELYQLGESIYGLFNSRIKKTLYMLCKVWPEFSGDECFPVPSCLTRWDAEQAYFILDRWYEGEYAAARVRLLNFLIEETK